MDTDLTSILVAFSILTNGDIATASFVSRLHGWCRPLLQRLRCLSFRLFKPNVGFTAVDTSKQFTLDVMGSHYAPSTDFSKKNNPYLYYFKFPQSVSLGAFAFHRNLLSNSTYGAGGIANYGSIASIIGASYDKATDNFMYVHERWPQVRV
ncbi:hypothetical protein CC80DRAFT_553015 [Byssothecium circinans]|uniref:Uncharacterized protein n=1 Tax=Byssothecium circinans TaxID=147558 RepID=A0A6A5TH73_9PLEO|nr:hypothetical protein CC80DRAFT_553015 [Byssothecium circinans]